MLIHYIYLTGVFIAFVVSTHMVYVDLVNSVKNESPDRLDKLLCGILALIYGIMYGVFWPLVLVWKVMDRG